MSEQEIETNEHSPHKLFAALCRGLGWAGIAGVASEVSYTVWSAHTSSGQAKIAFVSLFAAAAGFGGEHITDSIFDDSVPNVSSPELTKQE